MNILCLGDSLTYGYGVERAYTWCTLASQLTGHDFINRGINGATTGEIMEQKLFGDELFIMGGLNNLFMGMPVSVPLADIRRVCERALQQNIRPTVGIPMQISQNIAEGWCDGPIDMDIVRASYAEFADKLLCQCKKDHIEAIDFRPDIGPADLSFDGIHLNRQGHRHMANIIAAFWNARSSQNG